MTAQDAVDEIMGTAVKVANGMAKKQGLGEDAFSFRGWNWVDDENPFTLSPNPEVNRAVAEPIASTAVLIALKEHEQLYAGLIVGYAKSGRSFFELTGKDE